MTSTLTQTTIKGITYNILAEVELEGRMASMQNHYVSMLMLQRPNGHLKFDAMRDVNGDVTLN